ncbi:hypothetical protein AB0N46_32600, partial [Streptomyces albidoflavus]|uniref:hypothetical protein n=1 Tax=Streptomyces albidoflavus TaxID=1886 RepID=UPI00344156B6
MPGPLGIFCNDNNSFCIDITHAENDGQLRGTLEERGHRYPIAGTYRQRDSTYTEIGFMADIAGIKGRWWGEIDSLRGYPTLSVIRAHASPGAGQALTGYHLKEKPVAQPSRSAHATVEKPRYGGSLVHLKRWMLGWAVCTGQDGHFHELFTFVRRYIRRPTTACVVAYGYARIR